MENNMMCNGNSSNNSGSSPPPKKVFVKVVEMSDNMLEQAINTAITAFENHTVKEDVAEYIKKMFDKLHGPSWHCIVGNFGCYVSHEKEQFVCLSLEETTICLYKTAAIV